MISDSQGGITFILRWRKYVYFQANKQLHQFTESTVIENIIVHLLLSVEM